MFQMIVTRGYTAWKRLFEQDQKQVMRLLVDAGWLEPDGRGWTVNPRVHETFPEVAEAERIRRRVVREAIEKAGEQRSKDER